MAEEVPPSQGQIAHRDVKAFLATFGKKGCRILG